MHIFMSYARADVEIVQPLSVVLGALGIRTWLDTEALPPGTSQWDQMIRTALKDAHALIAFCSENARESQFMAIELEIAKSYKTKIFPVWISGENWSQSAPVSLVLSQHIDLRRQPRREGIFGLIRALKQHLATAQMSNAPTDDTWPFLQVEWKNKHVCLNLFSYKSWAEMLTEVYLSLLENTFAPFTYGEKWALAISGSQNPNKHNCPLFALPASWAATPFRRVHDIDPVWVNSPADVELAPTFEPMRSRDRSKVQVVDLRTLSRGIDFIGLRCNWRTYSLFATAGHPKVVLSKLHNVIDSYGIEDSQAFEHFEISVPRAQAVTFESYYYDILLDEASRFGVRQGNIIEFEEDRKWKARGIMRALRTRDGYAICSYCLSSFPTEGSAAQAGGRCPKCKSKLEFADVEHEFVDGTCRRCGCSAKAVLRCGWECAQVESAGHLFAGDICRRCGCSAQAVRRFGWECK
jgi:hypothetical protein